MTQAELAYNNFKKDFDLKYDINHVNPVLIKLCFLKGYQMGTNDMYKTVTDALLPKQDKQSV